LFALRRGGLEHPENQMKNFWPIPKLTAAKICLVGPHFVPCTLEDSLLETVIAEADSAKAGVKKPASSVGSSFEHFQNLRQHELRICRMMKSISWG
jgi:hypothetical protein